MCKKEVGNNSLFCCHSKSWIHHCCSNIIIPDPNVKYQKCCQEREITPALQEKHGDIGNNKLEVVRSFCYLGDVTNESRGCHSATIPYIRSAWKKFHELISIVCNKSFSLANRGHIYNSCLNSVLVYACETWPLNVKNLSRLSKEHNSILRWMCSVKISDFDVSKSI